ncbi:MAG: hypothetical protein IPO90_06375 [Flavobacteriales bacterium]|nr:hypothetical protein [Flavobacteriales bacterium]
MASPEGEVLSAVQLFILRRGEAPRQEFQKVTGRITYLADVSPDVKLRYNAKKRFLVVDGRPPVFELFIGMDAIDFSPDLQRIDSMQVGDTVDVYYDVRRRIGPGTGFNTPTCWRMTDRGRSAHVPVVGCWYQPSTQVLDRVLRVMMVDFRSS